MSLGTRVVDRGIVLGGEEVLLVLRERVLEQHVEDGRPMTNGIIMCGNTTTSRKGTIGSVS